uniref:Peptidoglycan recognition protein family domain-containing protein n=1 Tax=Stomoxys calcitrans TaxID=35570 RepID=A0A1I8PAX2_STOCA
MKARLPSITFSLDLVHHDVWSIKKLPMGPRMDPLNVDSVMITQTGSNNCDNPIQCQNILQQMQSDYSNRLKQELPYNFLIGCDGVAYEVRGWTYESGMEGVDQKRTLVIGLIGNFDYTSPPHVLIKTLKFLMKESVKRRKLKRFHQVHNLNKFCTDCVENTLIQ